MLKNKKLFLFFIFILFSRLTLFAQLPIYLMPVHDDETVFDCKGEFHDSDAGALTAYLHSALDTFRICTGGIITMSFQQFQLENGNDTLFFYNGLAMNSGTLIGMFTGSNIPTGIVANGCLTIFFKSDNSFQDIGWKALWTSTVVPPIPPLLNVTPTPSCNANSIEILLSKKINCDSAYSSAFVLTGPNIPTVTGSSSIGCLFDSTNNFQLQLSHPLTENCNYYINYTINMLDNCDSVWTFIVTDTFTITDCLLTVNILSEPNDTICSGSCVQLESVLNSCLGYNYIWSHGLPATSSQIVCPLTTTTYTLGVQSTSGGPVFNSFITITVLDPQITPPPKDTVCQSDAPFNFTAFPPGGIYTGKGILDSLLGTFHPDTAKQGYHFIYYKINGLCKDSFAITVLPMDAGLDEAACPGTPAFALSGYTPLGGSWSGYSGLTAAGVFDPSTLGTYVVNYLHPNGCSDFKNVYVQPLIVNGGTDSICESLPLDTMLVSPPGGRWVAATGIIDTINGVLDPGKAGAGLHHFYYKLNGCIDTAHIYIKPINAGDNLVFCPLQPISTIVTASPANGTWSNIGTNNGGISGLLNDAGLYNPGIQGISNFADSLVYTAPNGCTDTMISYVLLTNIINDSMFFCLDDDSLILKWETTKNYPGGGVWSGTGVVNWGYYYYFKPALAGVGIHTLLYNANSCSDTIQMIVHPAKLSYNDTTVCSTHPTFILDPIGVNANWQGTGILNTSNGLFDPSITGAGTFPIVYSTPNGCKDTINVTVYPFVTAQIANLNNYYCFRDFNYPSNLMPSGGAFSGPGTSGNVFNPAVAGEGRHQLIYSYGTGICFTSDTLMIIVSPPIQTSIINSDSAVCLGASSTINVSSTGGDSTVINHSYTWSHGLFATTNNVVSPVSTTSYTITTSDGCSDDVIDTVTVNVFQNFSYDFITSPIGCNGQNGTASVNVIGPNTYSYSWLSNPVQTTNAMNGIIGSSYDVKIIENPTGCYFDTTITIPGYGIISSLFSINPSLSCIPLEQTVTTFIDLSIGASHGYWEMGDGTIINYIPGVNPEYSFTQPGAYSMKLHVENIGNCASEFEKDLCILEPFVVFVPDIFSPNGDGINDILFVRVKSVSEFYFILYDRWGEKVFETNNTDLGWDGRFNNNNLQSGVYVWFLSYTMVDGTINNSKGDVSLIR